MLVIMHDGNLASFLQFLLYIKAFRRFDVLQVYSAKCRFKRLYDLYEFFGIGLPDFYIKYIDIGKDLEENTFPFHDRFTGLGAYITQSQYGRTVTDDTHQVSFGSIFIYIFGVGCYLEAGDSYTGGISE